MTVTEETRHFTASAAVIDPAHECVLLVEHLLTGRWQFPGGHVDADETGDEAAVREVFEETGVQATPWVSAADRVAVPGATRHITPLMVCEFPAPADPDPAWLEPAHFHIDLLYLATADSATPLVVQADEVGTAAWVPLLELGSVGVRDDVPVVARIAWGLLVPELTCNDAT